MTYTLPNLPLLYAFDLDGTILNTDKILTPENIDALKQISESGAIIVFASGRIQNSIFHYVAKCPFPVAILSLNGALVYMDHYHNFQEVYSSSLSALHADYIIDYAAKNRITINYYFNNKLYATRTSFSKKWIDLYSNQTSSEYHLVDSLAQFKGHSPSKIIMIADPATLDTQQDYFKLLWKDTVYICRTWDYYLEFLNPCANKGTGLQALADAYDIDTQKIIAFGDAENDIPMFQKAGMSIAAANSSEKVKMAAKHVSQWNNNEHLIAKEWKQIQKSFNCK